MKRKKTFYILRYIFAVVLIIGGLGNLSASVPFGLCVTLAGVSLFPFIWNLIRKKAAIARWVPLLVPLLFFIAATPFTPESAAQSRTIAITDEASDTPEAVVTDTPEITPAEVPTDTPTPETTPEETATPTPTETPTPEPTKEVGEMKVHFLDVGQGLSILVQSDGQTMIYGGGDKSTSSFVVSYLQKQNITTIDYLISSHYDRILLFSPEMRKAPVKKPCVNPALTSPAMYWFRDITVLPQLPAGIFSRQPFQNMQ